MKRVFLEGLSRLDRIKTLLRRVIALSLYIYIYYIIGDFWFNILVEALSQKKRNHRDGTFPSSGGEGGGIPSLHGPWTSDSDRSVNRFRNGTLSPPTTDLCVGGGRRETAKAPVPQRVGRTGWEMRPDSSVHTCRPIIRAAQYFDISLALLSTLTESSFGALSGFVLGFPCVYPSVVFFFISSVSSNRKASQLSLETTNSSLVNF